MKRLLKSIALMLAVLIMLAGCQTGNTAWAYMLYDDVMPSGVYLGYLLSSYTMAAGALYQEELAEESDAGKKSIAEMTPAEILKLQYEGMPLADWMVQNAQRDARHYLAIRAKSKELGLNLTQTQIDYSVYQASSSIQEYEELFRDNGISESSLVLSYQVEAAREDLFNTLYDKGGEFEAPQSELNEYLAANYSKAEYLYIAKPSAAVLPEDESQQEPDISVEELRQRAEGYLDYLKEGESIVELAYLQELEDLELGTDPSTVEKRTPEELSLIVGKSDEGNIDPVVLNGLLDTPVGECGMLETDYYFLVFRRVETTESDAETKRYSLLQELRYDDFMTKLDEWSAELPITVNQAAISRYVPSRLKLSN